ncbi:hypothetical protein NDU88_007797 [Pleurodeles waltl]|uniref:Uncharacterized protein n=1 Tax=Pleurodeles waltl TaxID=8319 RepID=A0AAV7PQ23_PLEWA|nr:hypothetical protein NDU88_007797 [Pleurodeles waltl]
MLNARLLCVTPWGLENSLGGPTERGGASCPGSEVEWEPVPLAEQALILGPGATARGPRWGLAPCPGGRQACCGLRGVEDLKRPARRAQRLGCCERAVSEATIEGERKGEQAPSGTEGGDVLAPPRLGTSDGHY